MATREEAVASMRQFEALVIAQRPAAENAKSARAALLEQLEAKTFRPLGSMPDGAAIQGFADLVIANLLMLNAEQLANSKAMAKQWRDQADEMAQDSLMKDDPDTQRMVMAHRELAGHIDTTVDLVDAMCTCLKACTESK